MASELLAEGLELSQLAAAAAAAAKPGETKSDGKGDAKDSKAAPPAVDTTPLLPDELVRLGSIDADAAAAAAAPAPTLQRTSSYAGVSLPELGASLAQRMTAAKVPVERFAVPSEVSA